MLSLIKAKLKVILVSLSVVAVASTGIYYFASGSGSFDTEFNPAFKAYVSAYTGGVISKESPVQIRFVSELASEEDLGKTIENTLFKFIPDIKGTTFWVDKNTIQFQPAEPLVSGQNYKTQFKIGKLLDMPKDLKEFNFQFQTMNQAVEVMVEGNRPYNKSDLTKIKIIGSLVSYDVADNDDIEKVLTAVQDNKNLSISWEHDGDRRTHQFIIENAERKENTASVLISWNGSAIGCETMGELNYEIPSLSEFKLMSAQAIQGEEQYAELQFSDPIDEKQNLTGIISISNIRNLRMVVSENVIKVYPPIKQTGPHTVTIDQGLKNSNGKKLGKKVTADVNFEELKPQVRITGKGNILPSSEGLNFPFEAVSLRSVKVKITKVYENNIVQFFQVNKIEGNREMKRVGKTVLNKTIPLANNNPSDYSRWKKYYLDLSSLIQAEPGAIYQVKLTFNKKDIFYTCPESTNETDLIENDEEDEDFSEEESSSWDYYDDYYYYSDYDYSERNNPCSNSYYSDSRSVTKNIFASDLGLMAKIGTSGNMLFVVTDLKTTQPVANAEVLVYNYQQQIVHQTTTENNGIASVDMNTKPFLVAVKKDNQVGYLKLDNSSALSISNFDVSGAKVQKGLKGYIYGERGVWRPGDSLYLAFILEDKLNNIPENQPVVFELTNPMGQVTKKIISTKSVKGFYNFSTNTAPDAPTGNWSASVKVGGAKFTYPVKIETIMPNRLKINLDFGAEKITAAKNELNATMGVKWLHGAVARNLKADINMTLHPTQTKFNKYDEYAFDDPARTFYSETVEIFDGKINDNGEARIRTTVNTEGNAPGVLKATFKTKVYEEGGSFSIDRYDIPYYPYNAFTGIRVPKGDKSRNMLLTDTNHVVDIVSLDADGKLLSDREIEIQVFKISWKWWWDRSEDDLSVYLDNSYRQPIQKQTIRTQNGKARWNFRINYPEWGRYYVRAYDKKSKHSTGKIVFVDWPGWAGNSQERNQGGASMLSFSTDKESYKTGDDIVLNIPGNSQGRALVSIESGSKVLETHWVETVNGKNQYTIKASDEMAPTAYVSVTLLQPHAQTKNDLPIRLYGIIPVKVENPETILKPVISVNDELRPEEEVTVSIKEENGKPMVYTIAIVDEGLLDLTRFKTPEPWNHFYAREALGVNTWDMYEQVIGAHGEKIEKVLSIGGDGDAGKKETAKNKRFKPVVIYLGPFYLDANKSAKHTYTMPMYVGSVKTMVVAGSPSGAYGHAEKVSAVRKPVMVLATLPRVLGPEETVALPVNIFAMTPNVKNVSVEVKTNNMFTLTDSPVKNISFSRPGDETVYFYMKAKSLTGQGKVTVTASSGNEKATHEIHIDIRNPNQAVSKIYEELIQPSKEWSQNYEVFGIAGSNKGVLEVSSIPPVNLDGRLRYLVAYPYGCVEQTTSSVFPQLFVNDLTETSDEVKKRTEGNIKAGIERLRTFQLPEGGLSYWPGNDTYNDWGTTYAGQFMLEAEKKGYNLPQGFINSWKNYQKKQARNYQPSKERSDLMQAYRLYTLALAKDPEMGAMNRLRETATLSPAARWRLAGAYHLAGYTDIAKGLISNAATTVADYKEMDYTFGSSTRDKAMMLEVMSIMGMQTQGNQLLKDISAMLSGNNWMSTQESAFCLMAISKYAGTSLSSQEMSFVYTNNNQKAVNASTARKIGTVVLDSQSNGKVKVKNISQSPLYARVIMTGTPAHGMEEASENNLAMSIVYKTKAGRTIEPGKIEQGTDFIAEVTIANPGKRGHYKNMALKQIFPSGWEIHNARLFGSEGLVSDIPDYQDYRDDRVFTFFDLKGGESKKFQIMLNAAYLGKFYLPMTYAEAMYDGSVNATIPGQWVEVVKIGQAAISLNTDDSLVED